MADKEHVVISPFIKHITRPIKYKEVKTIEIAPEHNPVESDILPKQEEIDPDSEDIVKAVNSLSGEQDPHFNTNYHKYGHIAMMIIIVAMICSFWLIFYYGVRAPNITQVYSITQSIGILIVASLVWATVGYNFYHISLSLDDPHRITWGTLLVFLYALEAWYFFEAWHRPNLQALFQYRIGIILYLAFLGYGIDRFIPAGNLTMLMYLIYSVFILVITGLNWTMENNNSTI